MRVKAGRQQEWGRSFLHVPGLGQASLKSQETSYYITLYYIVVSY